MNERIDNQLYISRLIDKLQDLNYHRFMGIIIEEYGNGFCQLRVSVNENILNPCGAVHGGILYSLCDVAAAVAANTELPMGFLAVTADISVSILSAVKSGVLVIEANVLKMGKRSCFIDSRVKQGNEIVAVARVTKSIISFPGMKTILGF